MTIAAPNLPYFFSRSGLGGRGAFPAERERDDARVRAEPFEVFELELSISWADVKLE